MQIVETSHEGLKRAYTVKIAAAEITARIDGEVTKIAPQVRMPGFRPGKVPANLVKKMHGPALHQEALNTAIRESVDQLVAEHKLRPAMQPAISLGDGYAEGRDAEVAVALEVLPDIAAPSLDGLKLDKLVVPVSDAEVDEAVARIASGQKRFTEAKAGTKAKAGDQLVIDFLGRIDGVAFDGGTAEDQTLEIGSGRFIPGFEEQLAGTRAGDARTITVTFPADYPVASLKGKDATFDVTVKAVKHPGETLIDEDFAKSLGLESLDQLRTLLRGQLEQESAGLTRTQMKRALLDTLAAGHDFAVPPSMVEAEFAQIWEQLEREAESEADPAAARAEMEAEREDYRRIAERRVRLGLLLSEIGQGNGVQVSAQEMEMLIRQAAQQYREQDRQRFADYVRSDAMAAAQLRAPLYEDKVVDFLFDKADVTTREVTRAELEAAIEADEPAAPATPAKQAATGKAKAEKPAAKTEKPAAKAEKPAAKAEKPAAKAEKAAPKRAGPKPADPKKREAKPAAPAKAAKSGAGAKKA